MKKISQALTEIVYANELLRFGLHERLFNLSQLARHLHPQINARLKKDVEVTAITMNLSRLQGKLPKSSLPTPKDVPVLNLTVYSNLCLFSYAQKRETHKGINKLYNRVRKDEGYITLTEGMSEIAVIMESKYLELAEELIVDPPFHRHDKLGCVAVKFHPAYLQAPGLFYLITQQIFFQQINIIEIASAGTELILYLDQADVRLAFDTIYNIMKLER